VAINLCYVNCGHVAANWSASRTAVGRNVVVASKSGPVETRPTILVATALCMASSDTVCKERRKFVPPTHISYILDIRILYSDVHHETLVHDMSLHRDWLIVGLH